MLKKKAAFKPKAPARRHAVAPSTSGNERSGNTDPSPKTSNTAGEVGIRPETRGSALAEPVANPDSATENNLGKDGSGARPPQSLHERGSSTRGEDSELGSQIRAKDRATAIPGEPLLRTDSSNDDEVRGPTTDIRQEIASSHTTQTAISLLETPAPTPRAQSSNRESLVSAAGLGSPAQPHASHAGPSSAPTRDIRQEIASSNTTQTAVALPETPAPTPRAQSSNRESLVGAGGSGSPAQPHASYAGPSSASKRSATVSTRADHVETSTIASSPTSVVQSIEHTGSLPNSVAAAAAPAQQHRDLLQAATPPADDSISGQVQQSIEVAGSPEVTSPEVTPAPTVKRGRKRKAVAGSADGPPKKKQTRVKKTRGAAGKDGQAPKTRKPRKRVPITRNAPDGDGNQAAGPARESKKTRRQRSETPEGAEDMEVDITQVKMADLTKDMRIGKKFSRHDELAQRAKEKRQSYYEKKKLKKNGGAPPAGENSQAGTPGPGNLESGASAGAAESTSAAPKNPSQTGTAAPQFQIIDGQIVLDSRSLQIDRHARAAEEAGELEEVEENEFSRHVTSATYLKRKLKPNQWTLDETELFYKALQSFGTDFETIARMFPGKERRHIKLKFNREERECPHRINAAVIGKKTGPMMGLDEYKAHTGLEYESTEAIYAEQHKAEQDFEDRQKRLENELAEEALKKREALFGAGPGNSSNGGAGGGGGSSGSGGAATTGGVAAGNNAKKKRMSKKQRELAAAEAIAGPEIAVEDL